MIYDPYSRPFQEDPYPLYKHFRDEEPCTYNPQADFYALFRFEDVWNATLDWETMSSSLGPVAREPRADSERVLLDHRHGPARAHEAAQRDQPRLHAAPDRRARGRDPRDREALPRAARDARRVRLRAGIRGEVPDGRDQRAARDPRGGSRGVSPRGRSRSQPRSRWRLRREQGLLGGRLGPRIHGPPDRAAPQAAARGSRDGARGGGVRGRARASGGGSPTRSASRS